MLIKLMTITECWCDNCHAGMLQTLLDTGYLMKVRPTDFIGNELTCEKCGHKNTVEDVLHVIPESFMYASQKDMENVKRDRSLKNHLDSDKQHP